VEETPRPSFNNVPDVPRRTVSNAQNQRTTVVRRRPATTTTTTPAPQGTRAPRPDNFRAANLGIGQLPADTDEDGIPGEAGRDYPTLEEIPRTSFKCSQQPLSGYYADLETSCQVVHICQDGGVQDSFLCPNGTIFNQEKFSCQWWYEVNCQDAPRFYQLNDNLYKVPPKDKEREREEKQRNRNNK